MDAKDQKMEQDHSATVDAAIAAADAAVKV
jgi:hypothetical protein